MGAGGVGDGIPYEGNINIAEENPLDPVATPGLIYPETPTVVWKTIKVWSGKGYSPFGIDSEQFELETYQPISTEETEYNYSLKFLSNSGNTQVRQGVMNFGLIRYNNGVTLHQSTVNKEAIRRMETYLINRYLSDAENAGGLTRDEGLIWAKNYVKSGYSMGGDSTKLFGLFVGIAALLGITLLG